MRFNKLTNVDEDYYEEDYDDYYEDESQSFFSSSNLLKISRFNFILFKNSIVFWVLTFLFLISQPLTMVILFSLNLDLVNYSFVFNISPLIIGLFWFLFIINKLFLENKFNGIDVVLLSKPISKYETFFSRVMIIFSFLFAIMFIQFIVTTILVFAFKYDVNWIIFLLVNNLLITPFISLVTSSLLILLAIALKPLWFGLTSFLVILLMGVAPVVSRLVAKNNFETTLIYDNNNYNSFSKLSIINGETNKTYLVDQINVQSQVNIDKNVVDTLNSVPFYDYLIPGEIMLSMSSSLMNTLKLDSEQISSNYSLLRNNFADIPLANLNTQDSVLVSLRPSDISPFELTSLEYEALLLDNVKNIVNNKADFINLSDKKVVNFLMEKIQNSLNWSTTSLSNDEFLTIRALLGIDVKFSQLFYYFNNKDILGQKTPNLLRQIETEINPSLANLLNFLWSDNNSKMNVYDLQSFGDISLIYPSAKIKSLLDLPNIDDVKFIKNDLVRFSGSAIHFLDINKQYVPTTIADLQKIDISIVDKASWDKFVDKSSVTLKNLVQLNTLLNTSLSNIFQVNFRPNSDDLFKYSHFMEIQTTTYLDNIYLPAISIIFLVIGLNILAIYMFKNKNYKN